MAKKRRLKGASKLEFEIGSGNVYNDLGFKDAHAMLAKARIVAEISRIIRARRLTQTAAATILGLGGSACDLGATQRAFPRLLPGAVDRASRWVGIRRRDHREARASQRMSSEQCARKPK
jgi:hypothetical protein